MLFQVGAIPITSWVTEGSRWSSALEETARSNKMSRVRSIGRRINEGRRIGKSWIQVAQEREPHRSYTIVGRVRAPARPGSSVVHLKAKSVLVPLAWADDSYPAYPRPDTVRQRRTDTPALGETLEQDILPSLAISIAESGPTQTKQHRSRSTHAARNRPRIEQLSRPQRPVPDALCVSVRMFRPGEASTAVSHHDLRAEGNRQSCCKGRKPHQKTR